VSLLNAAQRHLTGIVALPSDIKCIALALLLNGFAHNLISVFVPFIIISSHGTLLDVARFYLVYAAVKLCINYPAMCVIQRYSASLGLYFGFISGAIKLVGLSWYTSSGNNTYLTASAVALALANGFGWNAQHLYLSRTLNSLTRSRNLASIDILGNILGVIGPLIAATIATLFGAQILLWTAISIIICTLFPLRMMYAYERAHPLAHERLTYSLANAPWRDTLANFCFNVETAIGQMVWPVYLAIAIGGYNTIGLITAVGFLASLIVVHYAGKRGDSGKTRATLLHGCIASSCAHLTRPLAVTPLTIGAVAAFYHCSLRYMGNAWSSLYYSHSRNRGISYIVSMEIACDVAYLVVWLPFFLVAESPSHTNAFDLLFIVAGVAAYGPLLISKENEGS
jgi:MFS family permease